MAFLNSSDHIFRHIKASWMDGNFIDPAAFRLREENGKFEDGLSTNWCEFFHAEPFKAVKPLREMLEQKGRKISVNSKFALLNVGAAVTAAAEYSNIQIATDGDEEDPSHVLVTGYDAHNDEVAEKLAKIVMAAYAAHS
jgi:hypothetical protein